MYDQKHRATELNRTKMDSNYGSHLNAYLLRFIFIVIISVFFFFACYIYVHVGRHAAGVAENQKIFFILFACFSVFFAQHNLNVIIVQEFRVNCLLANTHSQGIKSCRQKKRCIQMKQEWLEYGNLACALISSREMLRERERERVHANVIILFRTDRFDCAFFTKWW